MSKFMLLPLDSPEMFAGYGPEEIQGIIQRYYDWTQKLKEGNHLVEGHKLRDQEGRVLRKENGKMVVRDGPYTETKEVIGGYWLVEAKSYDDAVRLAQDCPHVEFGNLVIRAIDEA